MAEEKVIIKAVGIFNGTNIKKNKSIDINFKFSHDERISMMKAVAFISQNVQIYSKKESDKSKYLGEFRFQNLNMDRDGETKLKFNSEMESVNMEAISEMIEDGAELLKLKMQAVIELEDGEEEDE